jgi:DNA-binding transcriptional LysR family regulator
VIELRQLAALVAIDDHGSFSNAAKALFTVQSNVSAHISRLETELKVTLVDRSRSKLTHEGHIVANRARVIYAELDGIVADMQSLATEVVGTVRLGVIGTTARWLVPPLLGALADAHPNVQAIVVEANTTSLTALLGRNEIDLAIVNLPLDEADLNLRELFVEDQLLVTPLDHPLAAHDSVDLADLVAHPILMAAPGTAMRDELNQHASSLGLTFTPQAEIDGVRLMASLAFQGFGPAILPATAAPSWLTGPWKRVAVNGLPPRRVGIAWRRRGLLGAPARAVDRLLDSVIAAQGSDQPGVGLPDTER